MSRSSLGFLILVAVLALPARCPAQAGAVDSSFNPALNSGAAVFHVTRLTNGKILIGGAFSSIGGVNIANLARLNPDGTLDSTFNPGTAVNIGSVSAIAVQPDGKLLVGGAFFSSSGTAPGNLARLNPNGTVDSSFDPDLYVDANVNTVVLQDDGRILFGGGFESVDGLLRRNVARLNTNGTLDVGFDACIASGSGTGATSLVLRSDDKILMSGTFTFSVGTSRDGLALLALNGNMDVTYAPQPGVNVGSTVYTLAERSNGNVLLAGNFRSYHDAVRGGLVQLTNNGAPDVNFDPGTGINDGAGLYAIAVQADGKLILGGDFASYNGQAKSGVARINSDGSLDPAFDAGTGPNNAVGAIAVQGDGKIVVAGKFSSFNGVPRNGLVRLTGDPAPFRFGSPSQLSGGQFQLVFHGENQSHYAIDSSSNLLDWLPITNFTVTNAAMPIVDAEVHPRRFYRARLLP